MKLPVVRTKIQTRYSDTDALGHISAGTYVTYMEVGRLDFYNLLAKDMGRLVTTVVADLHLDYLHECKYGDEIEVVSWCSRKGTKSLVIDAEIYANGRLSAKGYSTNVGFNPKTRQSEILPEAWEASNYPEE
ncbi:thioesterase family protein [Halioxenophilus sp. WMMB6]|uniref:acyl-CoA thioesterase n=1 Tax=Halioxenophilus sp. WMMB6 TaxID=3073815 RepID=UPI00295F2A11|nr:thioesterase family protein [Halioxenophilus sp. WMMB6]